MFNYARLFGIVPFGIGMTLLIFVWSQPFNSFHSPPLVFRFLASFVALGFVLASGAIFFANPMDPKRLKARLDQMRNQLDTEGTSTDDAPPSTARFQCANCGAKLEDGTDVSPHGDVKCEHCGKWFNVHQR